jgi:hypothetical protein
MSEEQRFARPGAYPDIFEEGAVGTALHQASPILLFLQCDYQFVQDKFAYSGSVLSSNQFALLSQLSQNFTLITKIDKNDS